MSDWLSFTYFAVGAIWFTWCYSFWWDDYRDDDAAGRRRWARATLLTPVWPLVVLWMVALLLRELGVEAGHRMPMVGQVIGDFALDAKGRSNDE